MLFIYLDEFAAIKTVLNKVPKLPPPHETGESCKREHYRKSSTNKIGKQKHGLPQPSLRLCPRRSRSLPLRRIRLQELHQPQHETRQSPRRIRRRADRKHGQVADKEILEALDPQILVDDPIRPARPIHAHRADLVRKNPQPQQRQPRGQNVGSAALIQLERRVADLGRQILHDQLEVLVDVGGAALDADDRVRGRDVEHLVLVVELGVELEQHGDGVEVLFLDLGGAVAEVEPLAATLVPVLPDGKARAAAEEEVGVIGDAEKSTVAVDVDHGLEE